MIRRYVLLIALLPGLAFGADWSFSQNELLHTIALVAFFFAGFHQAFRP